VLDPKRDIVFKLLLSAPGNEPLLAALIEAVVDLPAPIAGLTVLNPGVPRDLAAHKAIVLDVHLRCADGTLLDIEMETRPRAVLPQRVLYCWSRVYAGQLQGRRLRAPAAHDRHRLARRDAPLLRRALPLDGRAHGAVDTPTADGPPRAPLPGAAELGYVSDLGWPPGSSAGGGSSWHRTIARRFHEYEVRVGQEATRAEGREEGRLELARALVARGLRLAEVAELTGFPVERLARADP
jgi:hypothetical protein